MRKRLYFVILYSSFSEYMHPVLIIFAAVIVLFPLFLLFKFPFLNIKCSIHGIKSDITSPDLRYCCSYYKMNSFCLGFWFVQYNVPSVVKIHDIARDMKHLFILLPSSSCTLMWDLTTCKVDFIQLILLLVMIRFVLHTFHSVLCVMPMHLINELI